MPCAEPDFSWKGETGPMKRWLALFAAACFAAMLFTGCPGPAKTEEGPVTITIWHDKEEEVAAALQAELDKLAPDIVVKLERKDGLTEALKMVGNDPKAAPDMYFFAHDKLGVYAEMGILAPITDFVDASVLEAYLPMTIEAAAYKGEVYQLPLYFETLLYMYNRRYMSDEEVPKTTEALYRYMQDTTKGGHYGFVEQHSTAYYSAGWIHAFGGYIINEAGQPGLDSPETIAALEYHKKFVEYMPSEGEYATVNTLFREGKAHSTIGGPWLVPAARESGIDLGLAPMPVVDETGRAIAPYSGVQGLHVLKVAAEKKHDAIARVLRQLTGDEIGIAIAQASGCAPAKESCYTAPAVAQDDMVMAMYQTAQNAVPMPNIPEMDVMWTVAENLLADINMSGKDVTESAKAAQEKALGLIASMK